MGQQKDAANIHRHTPIPGIGLGFGGCAKGMNRSGIDDDIQAAMRFNGGLGNDRLNLLGLVTSQALQAALIRACLRFLLQFMVG